MIADHVDEHRYCKHSGYCESFLHLAESISPNPRDSPSYNGGSFFRASEAEPDALTGEKKVYA